MGAEEGDEAGEGAADAEVEHVAEEERLQFLVLLQREVPEPGLGLCGLWRIFKKKLKKHTPSITGDEIITAISVAFSH